VGVTGGLPPWGSGGLTGGYPRGGDGGVTPVGEVGG